ncbi:hypothetical protein Tco_1133278 [Tanacetum coccineum]
MFGEDAIPRPPRAPRKAKVQRSSSSTSATSGSQKEQFTELMQTQINLDREAKKEHMERELAARLAKLDVKKGFLCEFGEGYVCGCIEDGVKFGKTWKVFRAVTSDVKAPKEFTAEQAIQKDEEIATLLKENKARLIFYYAEKVVVLTRQLESRLR